MKKFPVIVLSVVAVMSCGRPSDLVLYSSDRLAEVKKEYRHEPSSPKFELLFHVCDSLLGKAPRSVMDKGVVPPSGDKHDYMSQGPYWWPNPDTPDGLPYVRRDGETNPEINKIEDARFMRDMCEDVKCLAMAYYLSGDEKYAEKASEFLKVWFLNPETGMNPNLTYAQIVPGVYDNGRCIGIIDLTRMNEMYDHIRMIRGSVAWDDAADNEFKAWMTEFTDWLVNSDHGRKEKTQPNNHGTYYDLLVCTSYLFLGETEKAREYVEESMHRRFDEITAEGAMPRELARTKSWSYAMMNLKGLLFSCLAAEKAGVDMWHYVNPNGSSIQTAVDWFKPYVLEGRGWDFKSINGPVNPRSLLLPLAIAKGNCDISAYEGLVKGSMDAKSVDLLYFPLSE